MVQDGAGTTNHSAPTFSGRTGMRYGYQPANPVSKEDQQYSNNPKNKTSFVSRFVMHHQFPTVYFHQFVQTSHILSFSKTSNATTKRH